MLLASGINLSLAQYWLQVKVDLKPLPSDGPLQWAVKKGYYSIVALLLDRGIAIEEEGEFGTTPLMQAVTNDSIKGHRKIVELLLLRGAAVSKKNVLGETPLTLAYKSGRDSISRLLREHNRSKNV